MSDLFNQICKELYGDKISISPIPQDWINRIQLGQPVPIGRYILGYLEILPKPLYTVEQLRAVEPLPWILDISGGTLHEHVTRCPQCGELIGYVFSWHPIAHGVGSCICELGIRKYLYPPSETVRVPLDVWVIESIPWDILRPRMKVDLGFKSLIQQLERENTREEEEEEDAD